MRLPFDPLEQIASHSTALYDVAVDLDVQVPSCPGWSMADLVTHLTRVHWSWATIARELRQSRLTEDDAPPPAPREQLVAAGREQAAHLVAVLRSADPDARCWTWAAQQDVAFIVRHQVQEAAIHHWDAANAMGAPWSMDPVAAADAVSEFLTFSVSTDAANYGQDSEPLRGTFALRATDTKETWVLSDGRAPGTVAVVAVADAPAIEGTAAELLLWLYKRADLDTSGVDPALLSRFRTLSYTD